MKWERSYLPTRLSKLRLLGSVGEPINPEAWIGIKSTSAVAVAPSSTHGGDGDGRIMITPLPG